MKNSILGTAAALTIFALPSVQGQNLTGAYVGLGVGKTWASDLGDDAINGALGSQGLTVRTTSSDDSATGWRLFGGYRFHTHFAVEGGYTSLGSYDFQGQVVDDPGTVQANFKAGDWNLFAVGIAPVQDGLDLLGKVGFGYWKASLSATGTFSGRGVQGADSTGVSPILGIGAQFRFDANWHGRLECERYFRIGEVSGSGRADIDLCSLGLLYSF